MGLRPALGFAELGDSSDPRQGQHRQDGTGEHAADDEQDEGTDHRVHDHPMSWRAGQQTTAGVANQKVRRTGNRAARPAPVS